MNIRNRLNMAETQNNAQRRASEARREARRRRAIRNRIIFGVCVFAILVLISFLIYKLFFAPIDNDDKETPIFTTEAPSQENTTAAPAGADTTAPKIEGVTDREITVGDTISYKQGVTVTDDTDASPKLDVDASQVDLNTPGTYTVTYTATDASGNTATATATVTVRAAEAQTPSETTGADGDNDPATAEECSYMKYLAGAYLSQMGVKDDMSAKEKALRIWHWVNWELDYTATSDKSSWVRGAIQAFDTHKGDCFNYFAAAKALLIEAGIPEVDVVKSDTSHSSHYWCLVDVGNGWYHFDPTPREGEGDYFFLVTDEQLDTYSEAHEDSHIFDHDAYPARATEIVTDMNAQPEHDEVYP